MFRKIICILLSALMIFGMLSTSVSADTDKIPEVSISEEASESSEETTEEETTEDVIEEETTEAATEEETTEAVTEEETTEAAAETTADLSLMDETSTGEELPKDVKKAADTFAEDVAKFSEEISEDELSQLIERFSGIGSYASGCVSVLEFLGIIEDETTAGIEKILSEVQSIQDKLQEMDTKLDRITTILINMAANEEEKNRQLRAQDLLSYWRKFNTDYTEYLKNYVNSYEDKINSGIKTWWEESPHEGTWVVYTTYKNEKSLTYSKAAYSDTCPVTADNGETILASESIGIPSECMPVTSSASFDINTYDTTFKTLAAAAIISAADEHKLKASDSFYTKWQAMSSTEKETAAQAYAADLLSTVTYRVACKVMTDNSDFVTDVVNKYDNYCYNILVKDSGVNALINVLYVTHGFEGEVKKDITDLCDSMVATAGYYGTFALSIAGQDAMKTDAYKKAIRQNWADTINHLNDKKSASLTGKDNYCYIANAVVDFKEMSVRSTMTAICSQNYENQDNHQMFREFSSESWEITDTEGTEADLPSILGDVSALVLYHQYQCQKSSDQDQTFNTYLIKNSVSIPSDFSEYIMTDYEGVENFALEDALSMKAHRLIGSYFETDKTYNINSGNASKIKKGNFVLHDKIVYDCLDISSGELKVNQVCAARASYCEGHWFWWTDEEHFFTTENAELTVDHQVKHIQTPWSGNNLYKVTDTGTITAPIYMLTLTAVSQDDISADSPLNAFDDVPAMTEPQKENEIIEETDADWSSVNVSILNTYDKDDDRIDEGIMAEIDNAVSRAVAEGLDVQLTDTEKDQLRVQMKQQIYSLQDELTSNGLTNYTNAFGLDGNDEAELTLASEVLPAGYFNADGQPAISAGNMSVMARYEPGVWLTFEKNNGKIEAVLNPAFNIDPILVVWDSVANEFVAFEIYDDVMEPLGLEMTVRIPVNFLTDVQSVTVRHYDMIKYYQLLEQQTLPIQSSGGNRAVYMKVTQCSPFELVTQSSTPSKKNSNNVKTGDENNITGFSVMLLSAFALLALTACIYKKRYKHCVRK